MTLLLELQPQISKLRKKNEDTLMHSRRITYLWRRNWNKCVERSRGETKGSPNHTQPFEMCGSWHIPKVEAGSIQHRPYLGQSGKIL